MTDAISASLPATASLPPARGSLGPAPADDPENETYYADFGELWQTPSEGMTFADFLDIINPLQHIPIVSSIYRMVTGDEIGVGSRLIGDALFAGIPGLIAGALAATVESASGASIEEHLLALLKDGAPETGAAKPQIAAATGGAETSAERPESAGPAASPAVAAVLPAKKAPLFPARPHPAAYSIPAPGPIRPAHLHPPVLPRDLAAPPPPATAAEPAGGAREAAPDERADARRRIAETLARARAQEAALLLANLSPAPSTAAKSRAGDDATTPRRIAASPAAPAKTVPSPSAAPFPAHPYMLLPGASPEQVSRAMERALSKYHQGLRARQAPR